MTGFTLLAKRCRMLCVIMLALANGAGMGRAEEPPAQASDQAKWPQQVVVTVGDLRTRIDGPKLWTLSGLDFQRTMMATEKSAYGTVLTIRNVGHLGTAHFLDVPGKPGQVDPADLQLMIESIPQLRVDSIAGAGQYIQEEKPGAVVRAVTNQLRISQPATKPTTGWKITERK